MNELERDRWDAAAAGWERHFEHFERWFGAISEWLLDRAGVGSGKDILDVACGPGQPAIAAAARGARVTAIDLAPEMIAATARRAAARGLELDARVMDAEALALDDARFDGATCRFGLMFAASPARAAGEIARVLRPGARFATAAWDVADANPLFTVLARALATPPLPPDAPSPFRLAAPGALARTLSAFAEVHVEPFDFEIAYDSPEHYWQYQDEMSSALRAARAAGADTGAIHAAVIANCEPYVREGRLRFPARVHLAYGLRAP